MAKKIRSTGHEFRDRCNTFGPYDFYTRLDSKVGGFTNVFDNNVVLKGGLHRSSF